MELIGNDIVIRNENGEIIKKTLEMVIWVEKEFYDKIADMVVLKFSENGTDRFQKKELKVQSLLHLVLNIQMPMIRLKSQQNSRELFLSGNNLTKEEPLD